jgi:hypothetical protein
MPSLEFELRFFGPAAAEGRAPAGALARALEGFHRVAVLIAAEQELQEARHRERSGGGWCQHHAVFCQGGAGSDGRAYALSAGDPLAGPLVEKDAEAVASKFSQAIQAVMTGDDRELENALPDPIRRRRALRALLRALPEAGSGVSLMARRRGDSRSVTGAALAARLERALAKPSPGGPPLRFIHGKLASADFRERRLVLELPSGERVVCERLSDFGDLLAGAIPADCVQALGSVVRGRGGRIERVEDIRDIRPLDLSPALVLEARRGRRRLVAREPAALLPGLDPDGRGLFLEWPELGLRVVAETRVKLLQALQKSLLTLWSRGARDRATPPPEEADRIRVLWQLFEERSSRPPRWEEPSPAETASPEALAFLGASADEEAESEEMDEAADAELAREASGVFEAPSSSSDVLGGLGEDGESRQV